jgi:methionyl-tRNA formyltransferase
MSMISKKILFFGSGPVAAASLEKLIKHTDVSLVITKRKAPRFKGTPPVELVANDHDMKLSFADNKTELEELILGMGEKFDLGIVLDYGVIITEKTIQSFPLGIINSHFSLLPEWRGADPITFSLLSGQVETGVSLMQINSGLDTGKLFETSSISISSIDTNPSLTEKLIDLSDGLLQKNIPLILNETATKFPQDTNQLTTFSKKIMKEDGLLNFNKPASVLEREIRAYKGWPRSYMKLGELDVIIEEATISDVPVALGKITIDEQDHIIIGTVKGSLKINKLMPFGKNVMSSKDFLNGYRNRLSLEN